MRTTLTLLVDVGSDLCPCCSGEPHRIGEDVAEHDVRASLLLKGTLPVMPPKANRREAACDFRVYKDRNRVGPMFSKLQQFRRIATRYDKTAASFLGFLARAVAKLWMPT